MSLKISLPFPLCPSGPSPSWVCVWEPWLFLPHPSCFRVQADALLRCPVILGVGHGENWGDIAVRLWLKHVCFPCKKERRKAGGSLRSSGPRRTQTMLMVRILCQSQGHVCASPVWEGIWNCLGGREKQGYQIPREEPELQRSPDRGLWWAFQAWKTGDVWAPHSRQRRASPAHVSSHDPLR